MLDPSIETFLSERKSAWLKDKLKAAASKEEKQQAEQTAEEKFALENWLPDAAKRAGWLSMTSHSGKFTHPGAKISPVIAAAAGRADGYLRSGNVDAECDVFGNAAALDVFKFLSLPLGDGQTILAHLEQDSDPIRRQFALATVPFAELRAGLLAIKPSASPPVKTSEKIKQVYFPVEGGYHLLSVLTPAGLMFKLKERIDALRFSESAQRARDDRRRQVHNGDGFDELYKLTVIGFGGSKPQNIGVLNNQHGGTAYLLPSMPPPAAAPRDDRMPRANVFNSRPRLANDARGRPILLIPRIEIQNANALSSPYTIGFPALSAWFGGIHALQRKLNAGGFADLHFTRAAVVCHRIELQTHKGQNDFVYSIKAAGHPLDPRGERPPFIEEARCHLNATLAIEYRGSAPNDHRELALAAKDLLHLQKMAGGDILDFGAPETLEVADDDVAQLTHKLMPGYVLLERRELMLAAMQNGRDAIDALLDFLIVEHRSQMLANGKARWDAKRKTPGWLAPIATGFHGIGPLGRAENQRDPDTPHRFAESLVTLGEFVPPVRIGHLNDLLWQSHHDAENNLYLIQQQRTDKNNA